MAYVQKKADSISPARREELLTDDTPLNDFISFLDGFGQHFAEQDLEDEANPDSAASLRLCVAGFIAASSLAEDADFQSLHPRVRNALLTGDV